MWAPQVGGVVALLFNICYLVTRRENRNPVIGMDLIGVSGVISILTAFVNYCSHIQKGNSEKDYVVIMVMLSINMIIILTN